MVSVIYDMEKKDRLTKEQKRTYEKSVDDLFSDLKKEIKPEDKINGGSGTDNRGSVNGIQGTKR